LLARAQKYLPEAGRRRKRKAQGHTSKFRIPKERPLKMQLAFHLPLDYNCDMKKKYLIKTKYGDFQALIWFDKKDRLYLVQVLSFDRSMTQGSSLGDAKRMAADLIELLCEEALDDGKVIIDDNRRVYARGKLARQSGAVSLVA